MLLNVHPAYRSSLHFIQLLAVAKSSHLKKYGIDKVLKPAVDDLLKLANDVSNLYSKTSLSRTFMKEAFMYR